MGNFKRSGSIQLFWRVKDGSGYSVLAHLIIIYSVLCFMNLPLLLYLIQNVTTVIQLFLLHLFSADGRANQMRPQVGTLQVTVSPDVLRTLRQTGMSTEVKESLDYKKAAVNLDIDQ